MKYNFAYEQFKDKDYLRNLHDTSTPAGLMIYVPGFTEGEFDLRNLNLVQRTVANFFSPKEEANLLEGNFQSEESLRDIQKLLCLEAGDPLDRYASPFAQKEFCTPEIVSLRFTNQDLAKRAVNILTRDLFFTLPEGDFFDRCGDLIRGGQRFRCESQNSTYGQNGSLEAHPVC